MLLSVRPRRCAGPWPWRTWPIRLAIRLVGLFLVVPLLSLHEYAVLPAAAGEALATDINVAIQQGLLTVDLQNVPLADVLRLIGKRAGLQVTMSVKVGARVTDAFTGVPLDQGLMRLLRGYSTVLIYVPAQGGAAESVLAKVWVYRSADNPEPTGVDRLKAVRELARPGDDAAASTLAQILAQDPDPIVRAEAAAALGKVGRERAAGLLTSALKDQEPSVRREAAKSLSAVGGATARTALSGALRRDSDPQVRLEATRTLSMFPSKDQAWRALSAAKSDADSSVREAAISTLVKWTVRGVTPK